MTDPTILDSYALGPMQQGLLFHHLTSSRSGVDLEQIVCSLRESLDCAAMERAWQRVAERHAVFRTRFRWEGVDEPVQEVLRHVTVPVATRDWRAHSPAERAARFDAFLRADREQGFGLDSAPLLRVAILRMEDDAFEVVWTFHHILIDGRSFPIVLEDVFAFYAAECGQALEIAPEPHPYRDHIAWLTERGTGASESFWRARLAGFRAATPLTLGGSQPVGPDEADRGEQELRLSPEATAGLRRLADDHRISLNTCLQGAWALLLGRSSGETDVLFGATRACRSSSIEGADSMVGLFINTLPVRVRIAADQTVREWLAALQTSEREVREHEHEALAEVQAWGEVQHGGPLFESLVVFDNYLLDSRMRAKGGAWSTRGFRLIEKTTYPLALYGYLDGELLLKLAYDRPRFEDAAIERMLGQLANLLAGIAADPTRTVSALSVLNETERRRLLDEWNATQVDFPRDRRIHQLFEAQAQRSPDAPALSYRGETLSYRELNERGNRLARHLRALGVLPGALVGIGVQRGIDLVVGILAIHKAGCAYVPLDPDYPRDRVAYMIEDSGVTALLVHERQVAGLPAHAATVVPLDADAPRIAALPGENLDLPGSSADLAYVIYTSGSTGRPKGVMVEHRNVANFFTGMDAHIRHDPPGVWLAVTSLSFDISVLELLWTLARGFQVVVYADENAAAARQASAAHAQRPIEFSLMYFASEEGEGSDKYRLLLEGAKYADTHDFAAVWTPERHFHAFGGLYPNPALTGAAVAAVTERVAIRAGSVVVPLHHPIRIAEEWAVVDNLCGGRVGISIAAGWQPRDFVLAPERFANAKEVMYEDIETVKRLWRGEELEFQGPTGDKLGVRILPRPIQPELPIWVTTAGTTETYRRAGEIGANILTHLLGQTLTDVGRNIRVYREAWAEAGHGAGGGHVTLMLHTFVGDDMDSVKEMVREPMKSYLRSSLGLIKSFAGAWTAFKRGGDGTAADAEIDLSSLTPEEMDGLLDYSFERYFETSALFGTREHCGRMIDDVRAIGVDEVACLIDFGVAVETALEHLAHLNDVRLGSALPATPLEQHIPDSPQDRSVAALVERHGVTHLQCTPSMARMLIQDDSNRGAFAKLDFLLIGGEAFPVDLANELSEATRARILNMYGPTETTIWSSVAVVEPGAGAMSIGRPIANTEFFILDGAREPVPIGVAGELYIGGAGVVRGYLDRPELTAERFVPHPFRKGSDARLYRTGDLARYCGDGSVEFLGRIDHQVKIRGHRIELGEIEAAIAASDAVREVVVVAREDIPGDQRLVAYAIPAGAELPVAELRESLRASLPDFMVPAHFVALTAFPQTPNRKIDRKALPPPDSVAPPTAEYREPENDIEERVLAIWKQALRASQVGIDDNFFDLGGHSLLAVRVHRILRENFEKPIAITDMFRFPTVRLLAAHLGDSGTGPSLQTSQDRGAARRKLMSRRRQRPAGGRAKGGDGDAE